MNDTCPTQTPEASPRSEFASLVQRAMRGDLATLPELRRYLDAHPELVHETGNLAACAERAWTHLAAGSNLVLRESISREMAALKAKLDRDSATPLEALMIDQVVLAWLESGYASARDAQSVQESLSAGRRDQLQRRVERANRRLLGSIKQLALVRKLLQVSPSPLQIAQRLHSRPQASRNRQADVAVGVGVDG